MKTTFLGLAITAILLSGMTIAQSKSGNQPAQSATTSETDQEMRTQLQKLQKQVQRLQAALEERGPAQPTANKHASTPPMMKGMNMAEMMGSMGGNQAGGSMPMTSQGMPGSPSGASMPGAGKTSNPMQIPGQMPNAQTQSVASVPHILHAGSVDFFLDHAQHLKLQDEQIAVLNRVKEKETFEQNRFSRQIQQGEEDLLQLTGADKPDSSAIEQKVREIEELRAQKRIAFIRAVSSAADVLSEEQRTVLVGGASHQHGAKP